MQTVDEQPETIHLYVVRETEPKLPLYPVVFSVLALFALVVYCALTPYRQPVTRITLRVPAVPLVVKTFTAQAVIVPTGIKTYTATTAHGVLTITNGSVIAQTLPAELTFISSSGVSVITDESVFVPAGSANGYGWAQVRSHAAVSGQQGNLPPFSINNVVGSSIYVRNTSSLFGGRDSYSVKVVTEEDRQLAVYKTRNVLSMLSAGLHYHCYDVLNIGKEIVSESWQCQFVTFSIPRFYHVTGIKLVSKNLILSAWFVERPVYRPIK